MNFSFDSEVQLVEVGLRDGLQNENAKLNIESKIKLAEMLIQAGVRRIELGAFVRADKVPQMADSKIVIQKILDKYGNQIQASALVPNEKGLQEALEAKIPEIAIFAAASETFSLKNINCTIEESFKRFQRVFTEASEKKIKIRGYLSTCFGCPYDGDVSKDKVVELALRLYRMGCYEISIGDTTGVATPAEVEELFLKLIEVIPVKALAGHFHDTRGMALANIWAAYRLGVRVFDASLGGLGGCPYAVGATGNVATEDVVYMFKRGGINTNLNLSALIEASREASRLVGRDLPSHLAKTGEK